MGDPDISSKPESADALTPVELIREQAFPEKPPGDDTHSQSPLRWRELVAIGLLVVLCDVTVYRGLGYAGYAVLLLLAPGLLWLGSPRSPRHASAWLLGAMLAVLAVRLVWLGSVLAVSAGVALLVAWALALSGRAPYVFTVLGCALEVPAAGYFGLKHYERSGRQLGLRPPRVSWLSLGLPLAAVALFGTIFVLANPDLVKSFLDTTDRVFRSLGDWIEWLSPDGWEVVFWIAVAWASIGLLRPIVHRSLLAFSSESQPMRATFALPAEAPLYAPLRNTLVAVIGLFAVYLGFEFQTLWFREFPKGFYYAGYAHEGAAWLTVALVLATVVLSLVFRGRTLDDPRLPRLRRLAWLWSLENLVLAVAVYHRLFIYIGFNGMTRMRTVGLFGMSAVVVGFVLVVWKIAHRRDFVWLLHRHLWTLAIAVYLYALTPVDTLVHTYNVRQVLAGHLAPAVQISEHPVDTQGILVLHPLVHCNDEFIREGIRALLATRALEAQALAKKRETQGWTTFQLADRLLLQKLQAVRADWEMYRDTDKQREAWNRFRDYAYQWY